MILRHHHIASEYIALPSHHHHMTSHHITLCDMHNLTSITVTVPIFDENHTIIGPFLTPLLAGSKATHRFLFRARCLGSKGCRKRAFTKRDVVSDLFCYKSSASTREDGKIRCATMIVLNAACMEFLKYLVISAIR